MQRYCQYDNVGPGDGVDGPSGFGPGNQLPGDQVEVARVARGGDRDAVAGLEREPGDDWPDVTSSQHRDAWGGEVRHVLARSGRPRRYCFPSNIAEASLVPWSPRAPPQPPRVPRIVLPPTHRWCVRSTFSASVGPGCC